MNKEILNKGVSIQKHIEQIKYLIDCYGRAIDCSNDEDIFTVNLSEEGTTMIYSTREKHLKEQLFNVIIEYKKDKILELEKEFNEL